MLYVIYYIPNIYLVTGSLYLLTIVIQFLLLLTLASNNHKSNVFFYEFVLMVLNYNTMLNSWYTTLWFHISKHFKMSMMINLGVICHQMMILLNYWLYSSHILFHTSVQFSCSVVSDSVTPWIVASQASLSIINSRSSLKLVSIESVMPSSHLILCCPLLLLPPIPPRLWLIF